MDSLPESGPISDDSLEIISNGGVLIQNQKILKVLSEKEFKKDSIKRRGAAAKRSCRSDELTEKACSKNNFLQSNSIKASKDSNIQFEEIQENAVLMPGFIDAHTHICYTGNRAKEYARRLAGESYLEIAKKGGGILSAVSETRAATQKELEETLIERLRTHLLRGVTTCEVKSGYGLNRDSELKMLRAICAVGQKMNLTADALPFSILPDLVATCLAAHVKPEEFQSHEEYLNYILHEILPTVKSENLSHRVDIFIEKGAFKPKMSLSFLQQTKALGFSIAIHADQFSKGGSEVASKVGAISADHLEVSGAHEYKMLKAKNVIANALPGASVGLGLPFASARKMLNAGLTVAIASDWNPGSAPMGDLLTLASLLGANQKLTMAETFSALTNRAAKALELKDRGLIKPAYLADLIAFPCKDFQEILYNQGSLKPRHIWKKGKRAK
jgi:imidazolonepropionase